MQPASKSEAAHANHGYPTTEHTLSITDEEIKLEGQEHRSCQAEAETKAGDGLQVVKLGPV